MEPTRVSELICSSYATQAMAQDGVERRLEMYERLSFIIRSRLYKGLCEGRMQIRSLFDDEKYMIENGARSEIEYALRNGKEVMYLENVNTH